jgi:hypothetical protein
VKNGPYELVIAPLDYPGKKYRDRYCYEHTLVYWKQTGLIPTEGFVIHHKNGNKRDNRFKNLEMISISKHNSEHGKDRRKADKTHGTLSSYRYCRCEECKNAKNIYSRILRKKNKEKSI